MVSKDKARGCLIGGAAGDALGYAVEFMDILEIRGEYGENGITQYRLRNGEARISDDTQMTMFTANGILRAKAAAARGVKIPWVDYIAECYLEWMHTQYNSYSPGGEYYSWLMNVSGMYASRAPGTTCMTALSAVSRGARGSMGRPLNDSKGCGGVMRVAPIGLAEDDPEAAAFAAAQAAAITHGHELGYIPAAALGYAVQLLSHEDISLRDAVEKSIEYVSQVMFEDAKHMSEFTAIMQKALALADSDLTDLEAINQLGEGWVAEETLAIAVFCAVRYERDFDRALIASVNHNGDSDSTGAVTGNILGAYLGIDGIPEKYRENLELSIVILALADDLSTECPDEDDPGFDIWAEKYFDGTYKV